MTEKELPDIEAWERLVYQCQQCGNQVAKWPVSTQMKWATCGECGERVEFHPAVVDLTQNEALAELMVRQLQTYNVVVDAEADRDIVQCYVRSGGVHLGNITGSIDFETHEVGPRGAYEEYDDDWPDEAEAFFNGYVRGLRDDWNGYGFPTHVDLRDGAELREDMSEDQRRLGELAGILD